MRRYDGGNNGSISFGGPGGGDGGFSPDVTWRALTELQRAGFIVQTAPAVPYLRRWRKWRLTMYAANGRPATKDFMRAPAPTTPENSGDDFTGAANSRRNVSAMQASPSSILPRLATAAASAEESSICNKDFTKEGPILDGRTDETFDAADTRTNEIHLEASPTARCWPGSRVFRVPLSRRSPLAPTRPADPMVRSVETPTLPKPITETATGLFGGGPAGAA